VLFKAVSRKNLRPTS